MKFGVDPSRLKKGDRVFIEAIYIGQKRLPWKTSAMFQLPSGKIYHAAYLDRIADAKAERSERLAAISERQGLEDELNGLADELGEKNELIEDLQNELTAAHAHIGKMQAAAAGRVIT